MAETSVFLVGMRVHCSFPMKFNGYSDTRVWVMCTLALTRLGLASREYRSPGVVLVSKYTPYGSRSSQLQSRSGRQRWSFLLLHRHR